MEPAAIVALLKDGGWGVAALTILAAMYVFHLYHQAQQKLIDQSQTITAALVEAKLANVAVAAALESRTGYFERLGGQVEESSQATDTNLKLVMASLASIERRLEEIARRRS